MKKLLAALLFISTGLHAEAVGVITGPWKGLHDADASISIADSEAQSLSNVDITRDAFGIKKRDGTTQFKTIGVSTVGVRGGYYFRTTAGSDLIIHANNSSVFKSLNGAAYTAFITTDTSGSYYDFTDSQGYLWRATSNRDQICRYDGSTLQYYPSLPLGNQVEAMPNRLVISGTSANPNRVNFSAGDDFTNFTRGVTTNDPFYEDFGLPGQAINAIKYAIGRLIVWTKTTMSVWTGTNQFSEDSIEDVSTTIGCNQPYSVVYDQNVVYWQAQDGHFYAYDGNSITWLSRKIGGSVAGFVGGGDTKGWQQTTQGDFGAGTFGVGLSSTVSSGDVAFSSVTFDNFSDGDYSTNPTWTAVGVSNSTWSLVSSALRFSTGSLTLGPVTESGIFAPGIPSTGTIKLSFTSNHFTNASVGLEWGLGAPGTAHCKDSVGDGGRCYAILLSPATSTTTAAFFTYSDGSGLGSFQISSATLNTGWTDGQDHTMWLSRSTQSVVNVYIDGSVVFSSVSVKYSSMSFINLFGKGSTLGPTVSPFYVDFKNILFDYFISTYTSQVLSVGTGITTWSQFTANSALSGGTLGYSFYGCSSVVCSSTTFTSSQTITSGGIPVIATAPFSVWSAYFQRSASSNTVYLNDVTVNWTEGSQTRSWGAVDKDHRIMWSVAEGTATVPNVEYIYDPRFDAWLKYDVPFDAPAKVGNTIYYGGPSTGVVYTYPYGNTDNGSAISAFWKSKDFIGDDPFSEKKWNSVSVIAKKNSGSLLSLDATSDNYITTTLGRVQSTSNNQSYALNNMNLPTGTRGTFINFKLYNNAADAPFEFYTIRYSYDTLPWRQRFNN